MNRTHYIYLTKNLINGKMYIGQRLLPQNISIEKDCYLGSGTLLLSAVKKYGRKNFKKEILEICHSRQEADRLEIFYFKKYGVLENKELFYNRATGGQLWRGEGHSEFVSDIVTEYYKSNPDNRYKSIASRMNITVEEYKEYIENKKNEEELKRYNKKINSLNKKIEKIRHKYFWEMTNDLRREFYLEKAKSQGKEIWKTKRNDSEFLEAVKSGKSKSDFFKNESIIYKYVEEKNMCVSKTSVAPAIRNYLFLRFKTKETLIKNLTLIYNTLKNDYGIILNNKELYLEAKNKYPELFPETALKPINRMAL